MSYTSFIYLVFLSIACLVYYIMPLNFRWIVLLAANIVFYASSGWDNLAYLTGAILISFFVAVKIGKLHEEFKEVRKQGDYDRHQLKEIKVKFEKRRKKYLVLGLTAVVGALGIVKYTNFVLGNISSLFSSFGAERDPIMVNLVIPMGVSFFSFQIISYLMDVYKGKVPAQKNFLRYALYISFFPSVVQGPIPRYGQLGTQLETPQKFCYDHIRDGAVMIMWGFAKKLILAERLAVFVNAVYDNYTEYEGIILILATVAFSFQIYADFSSCMDIASGSARIFGIRLEPNFLRPYFSKTLPEFWRRWHVTLGSWFRDYVFFPFSISKVSLKLNKKARNVFGESAGRIVSAAMPILVVWTLTGIWHGAEWKYVFWGLFHGTMIILSTVFMPYNQKLVEKCQIRTDCFSFRLFQMGRTFFLCCVGRVFFRAADMGAAIGIFKRMISGFGFQWVLGGNIFNYGLNAKNWMVVFISLIVLLFVSILEEKTDVLEAFNKQNVIFRWIIIYALFFAVLVFGKYGPGYDAAGFIYEQF